jgi:SSS family transporter
MPPSPEDPGLLFADWAVIGVYFAGVALIALRVSPGQRSTRDFFLGGRSLPWWAAALSIVATETSAVTFIGVPLAAYRNDWSLLQLVLGFVVGRVLLAAFFVRVFYRRDFETVYGYLAERFGGWVRTLACAFFLGGRVVASGVRLFAGCLALAVAINLSEEALGAVVLAVGVFGTVLACAGGIRAVVWADVILGLTFIAAAAGSAVWILGEIPGGIQAVLAAPELPAKLRILDLDLDRTKPYTLLAGLAGGTILTLATHGTDQDIAQRMLTCRNARGGSLSLLASAAIILPLMTLFLAVGTLLYFFYSSQPGGAQPSGMNDLFPTFITRELPSGLRGFVMAGLLAACVSSLTSVLNALASTTISDFYRPLRQRLRRRLAPGGKEGEADSRHYVAMSRAATVLWGGLLVLTAIAFAGSQENIIDVALSALTYFYGALLGVFLLGIFTRRGSPLSITVGMVLSVCVVLLLQLQRFATLPETAPYSVQRLLELLPAGWSTSVLARVPEIAWPYWTIAGTCVSLAVGALGGPAPLAGAPVTAEPGRSLPESSPGSRPEPGA